MLVNLGIKQSVATIANFQTNNELHWTLLLLVEMREFSKFSHNLTGEKVLLVEVHHNFNIQVYWKFYRNSNKNYFPNFLSKIM